MWRDAIAIIIIITIIVSSSSSSSADSSTALPHCRIAALQQHHQQPQHGGCGPEADGSGVGRRRTGWPRPGYKSGNCCADFPRDITEDFTVGTPPNRSVSARIKCSGWLFPLRGPCLSAERFLWEIAPLPRHGGHDGNKWLADMYVLDTSVSSGQQDNLYENLKWQKANTSGSPPAARACDGLGGTSNVVWLAISFAIWGGTFVVNVIPG